MQITLEQAEQIIKTLPKYLEPTGSYIREHKLINDLDFLSLIPLDKVISDISKKHQVTHLKGKDKRISFILDNKVKVDIWFVPNINLLPFFEIEFGLGKGNIKWKRLARKYGYKLSVYGLHKDGNNYINKFKKPSSIIIFLDNLL